MKKFVLIFVLFLVIVFVGCTQDSVGGAIKTLPKDLQSSCVPSFEICDAIDNDCDSVIDEGELCGVNGICVEGYCKFGETTFLDTESLYDEDGLLVSQFLGSNLGEVKEPEFNGYIVELKDEPVIKFKLRKEEDSSKKRTVSSYRNELVEKQNLAEAQVKEIISGVEVKSKFQNVFNGFVVDNVSEEEINQIKSLPEVKKVYPNYKVEMNLMDSVPLINADDVWQLQDSQGNYITGEGITIGIIDTGVDYAHSDLGGCFGSGCKVVDGWDFVNNDSDPMDDHGHGTHVAAIAAGNGILKGVAPDATIYAYKVLNDSGSGYDSDIVAAIERAVDPNQDGDFSDHVDVINLSLGVPHYYFGDCYEVPSSMAVDNIVRVGTTVVVSAGNNGGTQYGVRYFTISAPGCSKSALTVGASDKQDNLAEFTSVGPIMSDGVFRSKPDVVAPGVNICAAQWNSVWSGSECLDNEHVAISGTSMASPHVAGTVALLKQVNPEWTPAEIKSLLKNTSVDLGEEFFRQGAGRINVLSAVQLQNTPPIVFLDGYETVDDYLVNILGSAYGNGFQTYSLYYGKGFNPIIWAELVGSNVPIKDGVLFENWDTSLLEERTYYTVKLEVENNDSVISDRFTFMAGPHLFFSAKPSNVTPTIDSVLEDWELADASHKREIGKHGIMYDIYTKTVISEGKPQLYVGIKMNYNYYGVPHLSLFFDEGDDGLFGSGSEDGILKQNQEDWKNIQHNAILDGYYYGNIWGSFSSSVNFDADIQELEDYIYAEVIIPLKGKDGYTPDVSDIMVDHADTLGLLVVSGIAMYTDQECVSTYDCDFLDAFECVWWHPACGQDEDCQLYDPNTHCINHVCTGTCFSFYSSLPRNLVNVKDYAKLEINTCNDSDNGSEFVKGTVSFFDGSSNFVVVEDYCDVNALLAEHSCLDNGLAEYTVIGCSNGCSDGECNIACSDGTIEGKCSETKPFYCYDGELVENCMTCGCPLRQKCEKINTVPTCVPDIRII